MKATKNMTAAERRISQQVEAKAKATKNMAAAVALSKRAATIKTQREKIEREEDERENELHEQRQIDEIRLRHGQVI